MYYRHCSGEPQDIHVKQTDQSVIPAHMIIYNEFWWWNNGTY